MRSFGLMHRLSPIGLDIDQTISLQKQLHSEYVETLISCCLALESRSLTRLYDDFRQFSPDLLQRVVSDPTFNVALRNLARGLRESSRSFVSLGTAQLTWLIDSFSKKDFWAPFSESRSIYLPSDGVHLQSTNRLEGLYIHRESAGTYVSIDQSAFELGFGKSNFLRFDLGDQHWLTAFKINDDVFRVDANYGSFVPIVPEEYDREWSSPIQLNRWSRSISDLVQLLQSCDLQSFLTELKLLIRVIVPLKLRRESHQSSSSPDFSSVICMSWADDILQFLEAIVHEAGHHKLCMVERGRELTVSLDAVFRSPWRDDLRPAHGLIHGSYAFLGVTTLWDALLKSAALPPNYVASITHRKRVALKQIRDALSELEKVRCLTELGAEVVESVRDYHSRMVANCDFDVASMAVNRGVSSVKKNRGEVAFISELSIDCGWVLPLYSASHDSLNNALKRHDLGHRVGSMVKNRLPFYYLWWALPLVEAFSLDENLHEAMFWVPLHLRFGLIWRFVDEIKDGHLANEQEEQVFYDAALALLTESVERLVERDIHFSPQLRRLLFQFYAYRDIEAHGTIKVKDIWRRASAFLVVPYILRGPRLSLFRAYKEYCIFLGLVDDLEDGWEDLRAGRRTSVTQILSTKEPDACRSEFRINCDRHRQRLLSVISPSMTLWRKLLEISFQHSEQLIAEII